MRLQPLLKLAAHAGAALGTGGKRLARHVPCRSSDGSKHTLRFNLGVVRHRQAAGGRERAWQAAHVPAAELMSPTVLAGWQLIVQAPLMLQNKLPLPASIHLYSTAGLIRRWARPPHNQA